MTNCDMAIDILRTTNDGRRLYQSEANIERHGPNGDGWQLALIQDAVNQNLNANGQQLFEKLHVQVMCGDFRYSVNDFIATFLPELTR